MQGRYARTNELKLKKPAYTEQGLIIKKSAYILLIALTLCSQVAASGVSTCYGETKNGKLEDAEKLPGSGKNFISYSHIAGLVGRTFVHSQVKDIILAAYKNLESTMPGKVYKYAETGYKKGGEFKPHKTHQNGLSVDFMVPVVNIKGESVHLSTTPLNKFGYSIEFSSDGKLDGLSIDYLALAAHLTELHKAAEAIGLDLWRVIFDPKLQEQLLKTKFGTYLRSNIQFSKKRSWVRHDEHYHVDFKIPCKKL